MAQSLRSPDAQSLAMAADPHAHTTHSGPDAPHGHDAHAAPGAKPAEAPKPSPEPGPTGRKDALVNSISTENAEQKYSLNSETIGKFTNFLNGYTRRLVDMRQDEALWNSDFAAFDRTLLSLIGLPENFDPTKDNTALEDNITHFLKSDRGRQFAAEAIMRHQEKVFMARGYRLENGLGDAAPNTRVGRIKLLSRWQSKDPSLQPTFSAEQFRQTKALSDTEKAYLKAVTDIDINVLQMNAERTGLANPESQDIQRAMSVAEGARVNLNAAADFYQSLGFSLEQFGMMDAALFRETFAAENHESIKLHQRTREIVNKHLGELTMGDAWGQDASHPCFLRGDCTTARSRTSIPRDYSRIQHAEDYRTWAKANNEPLMPDVIPAGFLATLPVGSSVSLAEIYVLNAHYARAAKENYPVIPEGVNISMADKLRAMENLADREVRTAYAAGRTAPEELAEVRANAMNEALLGEQDTRNYREEDTTKKERSFLPDKVTVDSVKRARNEQRTLELRRLSRNARDQALLEIAVEMIRHDGAKTNSDIADARAILERRKGELAGETDETSVRLNGELEGLKQAESAAEEKVKGLERLANARQEIAAIKKEGERELGLNPRGDFAATIDEEIGRVDQELARSNVSRLEAVNDQYSQYETQKQAAENAEDSLRRELGAGIVIKDLEKDSQSTIDTLEKEITDPTTGLESQLNALNKVSTADLQAQALKTISDLPTPPDGRSSGAAIEGLVRALAQANQETRESLTKQIQIKQTRIASLREKLNNYRETAQQQQLTERQIAEQAGKDYDLVAAQKHYTELTGAKGTVITPDVLRGDRDIADLVGDVERNAATYGKPTPFSAAEKENVRQMLIHARTEQIIRDGSLDMDSPADNVTAYDTVRGLAHRGGKYPQLTSELLATLTPDQLNEFLRKNYTGWRTNVVMAGRAQQEARKRLLSRHKIFLEQQQNAQPSGDRRTQLETKRSKLEELKNKYQMAIDTLATQEEAVFAASGEVSVSALKAAEEWLIPPGTPPPPGKISLLELEQLDVDQLVREVQAKSYTLGPEAGTTDAEKYAWIRKQVIFAKANWFARRREGTRDDQSPDAQREAYEDKIVNVAGTTISPEDIISAEKSDIINRLKNPPHSIATDEEAEKVYELARTEAMKRRRIRYEELVKVQLQDVKTKKQEKQAEVDAHGENSLKLQSDLEAAIRVMGNLDGVAETAFAINTNPAKFTDNRKLDRAQHPGHAEAEYALADASNLPASYFELVNTFMGCDTMPDKSACCTDGARILPEDKMAEQLSRSLGFTDAAGAPLAHMNEVIPRLDAAIKRGNLSPADYYFAFRDVILRLHDQVKNV